MKIASYFTVLPQCSLACSSLRAVPPKMPLSNMRLFLKESLFSLPISFRLANFLLSLWDEAELNPSQTIFGMWQPWLLAAHHTWFCNAETTYSRYLRWGKKNSECLQGDKKKISKCLGNWCTSPPRSETLSNK